ARDGAVSPTAPANSRPDSPHPGHAASRPPLLSSRNRPTDPGADPGPGGRFEFIALVEAVGIEPTSGNPHPQPPTPIVDLRYCFSPRGTPIDRITAQPASKGSPLP